MGGRETGDRKKQATKLDGIRCGMKGPRCAGVPCEGERQKIFLPTKKFSVFDCPSFFPAFAFPCLRPSRFNSTKIFCVPSRSFAFFAVKKALSFRVFSVFRWPSSLSVFCLSLSPVSFLSF